MKTRARLSIIAFIPLVLLVAVSAGPGATFPEPSSAASAEGRALEAVVGGPGSQAPRAAPGGGRAGKIAFQSRRSGRLQIWIMNADGSEQTRLTDNSADEMMPVISPCGRSIAFVSDRDGFTKVYLMGIDGSGQRPLTEALEEEDEPAWSPDGTQVFFRREVDDGGLAVFAASVGDGTSRQVLDATLRPKEPDVSPDGSRLVFSSVQTGSPEIWIKELTEDRQYRIPDTPQWGMAPVWSPDGMRIAFGLLNPSSFDARVHVVNADGTADTVLTPPGETSEYPCWSPDGDSIAFQTYRDGNFEIYVMSADGSNSQRLTDDPAFDGRPSWGRAS